MPDEPTNSPPPPPLAYERSSGITRGAFRLLLLLTFINTILLGVNLMGPQSWHAVRSAYQSFKDRRARRPQPLRSASAPSVPVLVVIRATYEFDSESTVMNNSAADVTTYRLSKQRRLQSVAFKTSPYDLELVLPDAQPMEIATITRSRRGPAPPTTQMRPGHQLRLFGGSPGPADASHFTIPYELDGQAGVIDGWLKDDALVLRPRQGRPVPSERIPRWELLAGPAPATQAKQP